MVKIKYNNMKANKKTTPIPIPSIKRALRSAKKNSPQDHAITGGSSDEKVIQDIHKQFDNQQSINASSKSTAPILQDIKPIQVEEVQYSMRTRRTKYIDLVKPKVQSYDQHPITKQSLQDIPPTPIILQIEQIKVQQKAQKPQLHQFSTPVKPQSRNSKAEENHVFKVSRKSYRKHRRNVITQIPFRKFQDGFEQKIVVLMNRICHKKCNQKDVEFFIQKVQKISSKDLYNPYVISGIQTILNLLQKQNQVQIPSLSKLIFQVKKLSQKIWMELGKTNDYEDAKIQKKQIDFEQLKPKFIKKIYKILVQTNKYGLKEARERSFTISQSFFSQYHNYSNEDDLLSFFKNQQFLTS